MDWDYQTDLTGGINQILKCSQILIFCHDIGVTYKLSGCYKLIHLQLHVIALEPRKRYNIIALQIYM